MAGRQLIAAGTVVLDGRVCRPGWVETFAERIVGCDAGAPPRAPDAEFVSGVVVPGFVDMHVHGGGGFSYTDGVRADIKRAADFHRRHGTTTTLASLVTASPADLLAAVTVLAELTAAGVVAGIHLEGPWLSAARCGAHDASQLCDPDPAEIDTLLAAAGGTIRMATIAPERPGSHEATRQFADANIVVAVGHTDAT
ncbi:MAG TPA: amidohydrolase family protein, partial [Mycobacterium sp.]|nr:amidohydrolase family protein [Mycobacterium sp.]